MNQTKEKRGKTGHCPKCDSDNVDYGNTEYYDDFREHDVICKDCGLEFKEGEDMVSVSQSYEDENGEQVEIDLE